MNIGDTVSVMYGSELPFILRRCGRGKFKFIGHGRLKDFEFGDTVVEKTYTLHSGEKPDRKDTTVTWVTARRKVCTSTKKTTMLYLV